MANVQLYLESPLTADDAFAIDAHHVAIATWAIWRSDRFDGETYVSVVADGTFPTILRPDDIMADNLPTGAVLVHDEDGYYMGAGDCRASSGERL